MTANLPKDTKNALNTTELLQKAKFIVDAEGNQSAAILDIEIWEQIVAVVKSLENDLEIRPQQTKDELVPWEDFLIELAARGYPTSYNSPEDFITAIKLDFERGGFHVARRLAFRAVELYPKHEQIQKYVLTLAPPEVKVVPSEPERRQRFKDINEWLNKNRIKYLNRWIALDKGKLLADAASFDELIDLVGEANMKGVFFTVIY